MIVQLMPELVALPDIDRWFFLRYVDERGFHLRLRFRARPGVTSDLAAYVRNLCRMALLQLPLLPPSDYFPMVPHLGHFSDTMPSSTVGITQDVYEPELDKFGGQRGLPIAEELFEASSRIAVGALSQEAQGGLSRKTIAPVFMQAAADAFISAPASAEFWQDYSFYWLGSRTPAARDLRERFFAKGVRLKADGIPVVSPREEMPEDAGAFAASWADHLRRAARAYRRAGNLGDVTQDILAFNFSHLMNNRLGIYRLDEAYLGALLEQRLRSRSRA